MQVVDKINEACKEVPPAQLIAVTAGTTLIAKQIYDTVTADSFVDDTKKAIFSFVRRLPMVQGKIDEQMEIATREMKKGYKRLEGEKIYSALPARGYSAGDVLKEATYVTQLNEVPWEDGQVSGAVYHGGKELTDMLLRVQELVFWSNPLHPDVFPAVKKMEAEVVQMCINMFNGGPDAAGCLTSGGTESIIMAMKSYRDWGRQTKGIKRPNIVAPVTAHAAFNKAAHYFGIKLKSLPVDPATGRTPVSAFRSAIDSNTITIVGSAPCYSTGVMDSIAELAALAKEKRVGLHVDACLGGFVIAFMKDAGFPLAPFDFSLDGVTSISCDTHKYGCAPKGSSVVLYSNKNLRRFQYFVATDWPGGIYASPGVAGSRPGTAAAGAWAAMLYMGRSGYVESAHNVVAATRKIIDGIATIPGLKIMGIPEVTVFGFTSDVFDIYRVGDMMSKKHWHIGILQFPPGLHFTMTNLHARAEVTDKFLSDLREVTEIIMRDPKAKTSGSAALYGTSQRIPDRSIIADMAFRFWDVYYDSVLDDEPAN
eukprot:TRINITY_DN125_c0_g1_i1.p2 TRINITY_DN125_c0_g1~~TRINITY_DN125_c0_g1_i1.p2  ORF type:complete len:538 (+),score=93.85 TRINITY_DN125_c0_g1_i1:2106-3719(+)